ncbi:MAG: Flp family type IVb pilin [Eubacterium sp.]|nr:Flp family type IVb pilin [Eubacterium sp.]
MTFLKDENGQGMVEYALILGLIAIVAIVVLVALGPKIKSLFNKANNAVDDAA